MIHNRKLVEELFEKAKVDPTFYCYYDSSTKGLVEYLTKYFDKKPLDKDETIFFKDKHYYIYRDRYGEYYLQREVNRHLENTYFMNKEDGFRALKEE